MLVVGRVKKGGYFDSVTLMQVAKELLRRPGVVDAAVVMGTRENKAILEASEIAVPDFASAGDTDLLLAVKAESTDAAGAALAEAESQLASGRKKAAGPGATFRPASIESALQILPGANLALISVAGRYAADEAMKALERGLHVMVFSDNVPLEQEIELKQFAARRELLVMGPDCGTAIINGIPLGFANAVNRGDIGIMAASGTGLQEVSVLLSQQGCGISQAIGTGGRDVKKEVGGLTFLQGLRAMGTDPATRVIVLVSKPPHAEVLARIADACRRITKPVVTVFLGERPGAAVDWRAYSAITLEEAALVAARLSAGRGKSAAECIRETTAQLRLRDAEIHQMATAAANGIGPGRTWIRGLFSGGTFCAEAQVILLGEYPEWSDQVFSNTPLPPVHELADPWHSQGHALVDLGEDTFTVGRPHPMIDYALRNRKIMDEAADPATAIILLDVVLGFGAHPAPLEELTPIIANVLRDKDGRGTPIVVCSVTGTDTDPQNRRRVEAGLHSGGAMVMPSNAAACLLSARIAAALQRS